MDYITAIGLGFPNVQVESNGDPFVYENITWVSGSPLPSKTTLDEWIAANNTTAPTTRLTVLAFRNRFTLNEKVAIEFACLDNPAAPMEQRQMAAMLRAYMHDLHAATFVDTARPDTRAGVLSLEQAGIIGEGRALEILDTPLTLMERSRIED